jgi:hypothetical protein
MPVTSSVTIRSALASVNDALRTPVTPSPSRLHRFANPRNSDARNRDNGSGVFQPEQTKRTRKHGQDYLRAAPGAIRAP